MMVSDMESQKGRFGWGFFGKALLPYIYRTSDKYYAIRMIEMKMPQKCRMAYLHQYNIFSCMSVRSFYITKAESNLLNEINIQHCDSEFGSNLFTMQDLVVRSTDAQNFLKFIDTCYNKLHFGVSEKFGLICINKNSVVPYVVRDKKKLIPFHYFEDLTDELKVRMDFVYGWDLSYLKFCYILQNVPNESFDPVEAIDLIDIQKHFPTGTVFKDVWLTESQLKLASKSKKLNSAHWTSHPSENSKKMRFRKGNQLTKKPMPRPIIDNFNPDDTKQERKCPRHTEPQNEKKHLQRILTPINALQFAVFPAGKEQQKHSSTSLFVQENKLIKEQQLPRPIISTFNPVDLQAEERKPVTTEIDMKCSSQFATVPKIELNWIKFDPSCRQQSQHHVTSSENFTGLEVPYKVQGVLIMNMIVPSIRLPYFNNSLLITLANLNRYLFPAVPPERCMQALRSLRVELYTPNRKQSETLQKYFFNDLENMQLITACDIKRIVPQCTQLIRVCDIQQVMPQLTRMLHSKHRNPEQHPDHQDYLRYKRQRIKYEDLSIS